MMTSSHSIDVLLLLHSLSLYIYIYIMQRRIDSGRVRSRRRSASVQGVCSYLVHTLYHLDEPSLGVAKLNSVKCSQLENA